MSKEKLRLVENASGRNPNSRVGNGDASRLNFNHGFASVVVDKLVGHADLELAQSRNMTKVTIGENSKVLIKNMKKLKSAGELVRVGNTHEIGMDLLCEVCLRKADLDMEKERKN